MYNILVFLAVPVLVYFAMAVSLIASQWPSDDSAPNAPSLDFSSAMTRNLSEAPTSEQIAMRDGSKLDVRLYGAPDDGPLVIMLHGSGWNGLQFHNLASGLQGVAYVASVDLRGHGASPERRGDVDYIGQLEDDIADVIGALSVGRKTIVLGHSSGGGLAVRLAGGAHRGLIDHMVLLAPFLGHNAPTTRSNSGGWAKPLTRRIIGLAMLNAARITALNSLTVIQFNMPRAVLEGPYGALVTPSYSFRLNTSYAPRREYAQDIRQLPVFDLVVGAIDEAFVASEYERMMSALTPNGRYHMVPQVNHLGIVDAPQTLTILRKVIHDI